MKRLFFLVLAINVTFFIWQTMREPDAADITTKNVASTQQAAEREPDLVLLDSPRNVRHVNNGSNAAKSVCYALGPFVAANTATSALSRLKERGLPANLRKSEGRKATGYWVYLPPLKSRDIAKAMLREMNKLSIDSFLIADGDKQNGISVGLYNDPVTAQRRQNELQNKGFDVKLEQRFKVRSEYWLDVADDGHLFATADQLFKEFPGLQRQETRCEINKG